MDRQLQASLAGQRVWRVPLPRPLRAIVLGAIILLGAGLLWVDAVSPPLVGFAMTVAIAAGWCRWLERHPEASAGAESDPPAARVGFFVTRAR